MKNFSLIVLTCIFVFGCATTSHSDGKADYYKSQVEQQKRLAAQREREKKERRCRNTKALTGAYKGFVTMLNVFTGGAEGAARGYKDAEKQTIWMDADCE
ncbi:MAG TPA: hypothetical protein EYP59_22790 [Thiotrichaceae bacterium]|nr:hypothetical protein [Thiotrichaceae bacterium]